MRWTRTRVSIHHLAEMVALFTSCTLIQRVYMFFVSHLCINMHVSRLCAGGSMWPDGQITVWKRLHISLVVYYRYSIWKRCRFGPVPSLIFIPEPWCDARVLSSELGAATGLLAAPETDSSINKHQRQSVVCASGIEKGNGRMTNLPSHLHSIELNSLQ